jgi:malonyl CoA-acyl carrier protein transacylase
VGVRSSTRTVSRGRRDRLVDAYVEGYVQWREGCADLHSAYQRWADSGPHDRDLAFLAYRAALDREEKAALVYEHTVRELARRAHQ